MLHYRKAARHTGNMAKRIHHFSAGQLIFNPVRYDSVNTEGQDRPFTGYLFAQYGQQLAFHAGGVLHWNISAGATGKASLAEQVQRWYHGAIGIYDVKGWATQLQTEFALNAQVFYSQSLFSGKPGFARRFDASPLVRLNLGNAFTDATAGLTLRAGKMEDHANSAHYHNRVSNRNSSSPVRSKELYAFVEPLITYQAYNAMLQGGLFVKNKGPKTATPLPWVYSAQYGFALAQNRWTLKMFYVHRSRQASEQIRKENFVSIHLAYRFGEYANQRP